MSSSLWDVNDDETEMMMECITFDKDTRLETVNEICTLYITDGFLKPLKELTKLASQLIRSETYFFKKSHSNVGRTLFSRTSLSKYVSYLNELPAIADPNARFIEPLQLLVDVFHELGLERENLESPYLASNVPGMMVGDRLNLLAEEMRRRSTTDDYIKRVNARISRAEKNLKRLMDLEQYMFSKRKRLLVLRFDLGYQSKYADGVTTVQAKADLERFLANRRHNSLFSTMKGYCWKLEYGGHGKCIHIHFTAFLDGSRSQSDGWLSHQMGKYWVDIITKGTGTSHNCNMSKNRYKRLGIGEIHASDVELRGNLREALAYLAKSDICFRPDMDGARLIGGTNIKDKAERLSQLCEPTSEEGSDE